jgi:hypothetical protein
VYMGKTKTSLSTSIKSNFILMHEIWTNCMSTIPRVPYDDRRWLTPKMSREWRDGLKNSLRPTLSAIHKLEFFLQSF